MTAELLLDVRAELGEGPVWDDRRERLLWVDILAGHVHATDPESGADDVVEVGTEVGAVALRAGEGLVLAVRDGFALLDPGGTLRMVADVEADTPGNRFNDGACDRAGRFFAGTMAFAETPGAGALYRLDPDLTVTQVLDGVTISNGIGWSPDDRLMYFVDTPTRAIDVFDYDLATGTATNRRRFATIPAEHGKPDGLTLDAEGCLWVAMWGGGRVQRFLPDGRLDRDLPVPATQSTKPAFGGEALSDLDVTPARTGLSDAELAPQPQAGGVFRLRPGVAGRLANRFAG
jgi:sugar lactone lactonase YvrE